MHKVTTIAEDVPERWLLPDLNTRNQSNVLSTEHQYIAKNTPWKSTQLLRMTPSVTFLITLPKIPTLALRSLKISPHETKAAMRVSSQSVVNTDLEPGHSVNLNSTAHS